MVRNSMNREIYLCLHHVSCAAVSSMWGIVVNLVGANLALPIMYEWCCHRRGEGKQLHHNPEYWHQQKHEAGYI